MCTCGLWGRHLESSGGSGSARESSGWARLLTKGVFEIINGAHAVIFSRDAEADRAFFKDVLGLGFVDSGGGWPIFALPPAEVAVHPDERGGRHELYLLCADIETVVRELERKGIRVEHPLHEEQWGRLVAIRLPGGGELGIYQPKHPLASSADEARA